jgi:hypothetical protein
VIVPLPDWFLPLVLLIGIVLCAIVIGEVVSFLRGAATGGITRAGWALLALGPVAGLTVWALEWIEPALHGMGPAAIVIVGVALVALAIKVGRQPAGQPMTVALLGAGLLFQLGWLGGSSVVPNLPILGDALADAGCERDPYCLLPSLTTTAQAELRIQAENNDTTASGTLACTDDTRPGAATRFSLQGMLYDSAGRELRISVQVSPASGEAPGPNIYFYLEGALGGFDRISGEAYGATWSVTDSARAGAITFDQMLMESLHPGDDLFSSEHQFDSAHGVLTWECS